MGIGLGTVFSGDSLFGRHPGAAAVAVADLRARLVGGPAAPVVDAQWDSPFLRSLGAVPVARADFLARLARPPRCRCGCAAAPGCRCPRLPARCPARRAAAARGYIRSGSGTPSRPRPAVSTRSAAAHSASRDCRVSSSSALSTGHCS